MSAEKARNFGNCFWRSSSSSLSTIALPARRLPNSHYLCARATKNTPAHTRKARTGRERVKERVRARARARARDTGTQKQPHRRQEREYCDTTTVCTDQGNNRGLIIKHATAQSARTGFNRLCFNWLCSFELIFDRLCYIHEHSWRTCIPCAVTNKIASRACRRRRRACPRRPNEQQERCSRWQHVRSWAGRAWGDIARRAALCCVKIGACGLARCAFCKCRHVRVLMNGVRESDPPCRGILGILAGRAWVDAIPAFGAAMSTDDLSRQIKWLRKHNAAKSTPSASDALSSLPSLPPTRAPLVPPPAPALSSADSPSEADGDNAAKDRGPSWLLQVQRRSSCACGHLLGRKYWWRRESARGRTGRVHVGNTRA